MKVSPSDLDALRAKVVLSDLVSRKVNLSKAGKEWKALCPFHSEKTPSFAVNDEKGFYHCFGCGVHGDAIRWLTDMEGMSFNQAVVHLKELTGVQFADSATATTDSKGAAQKPGGGKLGRSETVTVRLDPKLNYLCELGARAQRRTKSSFIEWAIANSLEDVEVPSNPGGNFEKRTLNDVSEQLWKVDEPDRVAALAISAPSLLTHEEQLVWRYVRENGFLWRGKYNREGRWSWEIDENDLIIDRLRTHWEAFKRVALEAGVEGLLPKWQPYRDALDDDIPF